MALAIIGSRNTGKSSLLARHISGTIYIDPDTKILVYLHGQVNRKQFKKFVAKVVEQHFNISLKGSISDKGLLNRKDVLINGLNKGEEQQIQRFVQKWFLGYLDKETYEFIEPKVRTVYNYNIKEVNKYKDLSYLFDKTNSYNAVFIDDYIEPLGKDGFRLETALPQLKDFEKIFKGVLVFTGVIVKDPYQIREFQKQCYVDNFDRVLLTFNKKSTIFTRESIDEKTMGLTDDLKLKVLKEAN